MEQLTGEAIVMYRHLGINTNGTPKFELTQVPFPGDMPVGMRVTLKIGVDEGKVKQFLMQQCIKQGMNATNFTFAHVPSVKYPGYESFSFLSPLVTKGDKFQG